MLKLWDALPLASQACITIALLLLAGCLLLQCIGSACAEQVQSDGLPAVLVLLVVAEVAMIAGCER